MKNILVIIGIIIPLSLSAAEYKKADAPDPKKQPDSEIQKTQTIAPPFQITVTQDNHSKGAECCEQKHNDSNAEAWTAGATVALAFVTFGLAVFTYFLWRTTSQLVRDAKDASKKELRAYISVQAGTAKFQDSAFMFESTPVMKNTGKTPAYKVSFKSASAIHRVGLPENFQFPLLEPAYGDATLGAEQTFEMPKTVAHLVDEQKIAPIMAATDEALYTGGTITYEDVFGCPHETEYCLGYRWTGGISRGHYTHAHNKAT